MLLDFSGPNGPKKFEFVYEGFMIGGALVQQKGLTVMRREITILDKLESISEVYPCGKKLNLPHGPEDNRKLSTDSRLKIDIDQHEYDILFQYISAVPWATGTGVRGAVEVLDWLVESQRAAK